MYNLLYSNIYLQFNTKAPATGIGIFRILYGLITIHEICFLLYFNHLIFDPIPYLDVEFPLIPFFLCLWALVAIALTIGYFSQFAVTANYIFWVIFVNFTPMQRDFDGGFDLFMIGINLLMIFMPINKAFSIDNLRAKLTTPFKHYSSHQKQQVSILFYNIPVIICLGFLYFDSAIHKLFADHWMNGLGAWLPASMPYYISAIDMSWFLNNEILQKTLGYSILIFQFTFIFFFNKPILKPLYFFMGAGLHLGITLTLNIYPFGLSMLIFYCLVFPITWYQKLARYLTANTTSLSVFYDHHCPLCCRTVLIINHFDILKCIDFKSAQTFASNYPALNSINQKTLLTDLYALDSNNQIYSGVKTYAHIFIKMRYMAIIGYFLLLPGVYQIASKIYRNIADSRSRVSCDNTCDSTPQQRQATSLYDTLFTQPSKSDIKRNIHKMCKVIMLLFFLQLNSSIHYGVIYRLNLNSTPTTLTSLISSLSNTLILFSNSFTGITPHALYLHDHFEGYNHLIAITYSDPQGNEKWLPFVNSDGRMLSPNWGRVHSMWANIAVTPKIDNHRLSKFIMKTTAFWGIKTGLNLETTVFNIKLKKISAPSDWVHNLLANNLSENWITIGSAKWRNKDINILLPDDINQL